MEENLMFIDEATTKRMEEHARLYDTAYDKKEFLKNVSIYEQKIILMNSTKPYDVLNYLDELDLKNSHLLLEELTVDEIKRIIDLFSSEDKKKFYATFSDLSLVNQFIVQDKNSSEHIQNLSFERKVELIDSSDKKTKEATSVIYESMPYQERVSVAEKITSVDASYTLETTDVYNETKGQTELDKSLMQEEIKEEQKEEIKEEQKEEIKKEQKEELKEEQKEEKQVQIKEVFENNLESSNLVNEKETILDNSLTILEQFQEEKNKCEQLEIIKLINKNQILNEEEQIKIK